MNDQAQSRIEALERYTELGSGFRIATLDMELRGAGDLLGADQSGVVQSVGLELFCSMLQEATAELRGEEVVHDIDPELNFDAEALLQESYIEEVGIRLSLYKRLASASDEHEVSNLADEMENRFGRAPTEAVNLVELMRIKTELRRLKVLVCEATRGTVSLRLRADTPLDAGNLAALVSSERATYRLSPDGRLTRKAKENESHLGSIGLAEKLLQELQRV
jgi:transcription-repair coupling factor (superfamily II helicase)